MRRETRVSQDSRAKRDSLHEIYNRESITEPSLGGSETRLPRTENLNEIIAPALRQPRVNNSTQPAAERGWKGARTDTYGFLGGFYYRGFQANSWQG